MLLNTSEQHFHNARTNHEDVPLLAGIKLKIQPIANREHGS
jgi:hypothetical protein